MKITITNCRYTPKWDTLQTLLREATNEHAGQLTRIARADGGCDYRKPGVYNLSFTHDHGQCSTPIVLTVEGSSKNG